MKPATTEQLLHAAVPLWRPQHPALHDLARLQVITEKLEDEKLVIVREPLNGAGAELE